MRFILDGPVPCRPLPERVASLRDTVTLALGAQRSCALDSAGEIRCWGGNEVGQLGQGTSGPPTIAPMRVRLP